MKQKAVNEDFAGADFIRVFQMERHVTWYWCNVDPAEKKERKASLS